jgi:hypothetical protein
MTNYKQDIYARLAAGENVEDIAAELTKSINEANDQYKADQEAEAEKVSGDKVAAIDNLFSSIIMVLDVWGIDSTPIHELLEDEDEFNKLVKAFDEYVPIVKSYLALMKSVQEAADKRKEETAAVAPKKSNIFDRVQSTNVEGQTEIMNVEEFLNKFVR